MISVVEGPKKIFVKISKKRDGQLPKEAPHLLFTVIRDSNRLQKKEMEDKPEEEHEIGLPPQPQQYLKYPEYDWL